jgi:hypothetical protein
MSKVSRGGEEFPLAHVERVRVVGCGTGRSHPYVMA